MEFKAELQRIDERSYDVDGSQQKIIVDQIVHLGRSHELKDYCARETPQSWQDATMAIRIEDPSRCISRNHAILYPPQNAFDRWNIVDLNSLNGTTVNGHALPMGEKTHLSRGTLINFGCNAAEFRFCPLLRNGDINYAFMVGNSGGNLQGTTRDVEDLSAALSERGFHNNIETFFDAAATRDAIIGGLTRMQRVVADDAIFVFYFSGHGQKDGSLILPQGVLNVNDLFLLFSNFRGQILLILDGCHTFEPTRENQIPPNLAIVGNEGIAREGYCGSVLQGSKNCDVNKETFDNGIRGFTSRAIIKALRDDSHRISVSALVEKVRGDERIKRHQIVGHNNGTVVTIGSVCQSR